MFRSWLLLPGVACSLALLPASAWAGAPTEQLRTAVERAIQILEDPALTPQAKTPEREAAVREAAAELIDFAEVGRRALGRHWRELGEAQRHEFLALFRAFLERTYLPQIRRYQGQRLHFVSEAVDDRLASVQTRVLTRRGQEVPVTFRLHRPGERWLIYDINIEGVSLVGNYRAQFDQIIQRASYQGLLARMKEKLADGAPIEPGLPGVIKGK